MTTYSFLKADYIVRINGKELLTEEGYADREAYFGDIICEPNELNAQLVDIIAKDYPEGAEISVYHVGLA